MKVTDSIKHTLITSARKEFDEASRTVETTEDAFAKAKLNLKEKEIVLDWAMGLVLGADLMMKPDWSKAAPKPYYRKLYYVPSRSGRKYGHYIEITDEGVSCTCPGFVNRLYCHATRELQSDTNVFKYMWLRSHKDFDRERDAAMADTRREK
jgi:hypothetical protein